MKSIILPCPRLSLPRIARQALASGLLFAGAALGQSIPNPSFEQNSYTVAPGYVMDNGPITGWTTSTEYSVGLNPAGGDTTYANNGAVPDGTHVAFLWGGGASLSTTISGLTAGQTYKLEFAANASTNDTGTVKSPVLRVTLDTADLVSLNIYPVGGTSPYIPLAFEFTATAATETLTLSNDAFDDSTLLLDNFKVTPSSGDWSVAAWTNDADSGLDGQYVYTHAYNFGTGDGVVINGISFTGVAGTSPSVTNKFTTTYLGNAFANDANNVTGSSSTLARDFVYGGTVPAGNYQSISLTGLTPGLDYVITVYSVGFDAPSPSLRWATASVGDDRITLNQDQFDNNNGIRFSCRYTADTNGTATLRIAPVNPENVSLHLYGFSNREAVSRNVAPAITQQPASTTVSQGLPVLFSVAASGFPTPTYQWRFNGTEIPNATDATYNIAQATTQTAGGYDVIVANSLGSVTSVVARLTVGIALENPSFEADAFLSWPGYSGDNPGGAGTDPGPNWAITSWTQSDLAGSGINPIANGASPFADNGVIPNGIQVAFLQSAGTLGQTVTGLTVGSQYYLHYYENARSGGSPSLEARIDNEVMVAAHALAPGGYREAYSDVFTATATQADLVFEKSNPQGGDTTALIDNVAIVPVPAGTAPFLTRNPQSLLANTGATVTFDAQAIGSLPLNYQWTKNGSTISGANAASLTLVNIQQSDEGDYALTVTNTTGSITTASAHLTVGLPGIFGTGVAADGTLLAAGEVDPHYKLVASADEAYPGPDAIVLNDGWPIQAGVWLLNGPSSKWIGPQADQGSTGAGNAEGDYTYETTIDLTGYDVSRVQLVGGWACDNTGVDILVNGVSTGLSNSGFGSLAPFTISTGLVAGKNTLAFKMNNLPVTPNPTGLRVDLKGILVAATTAPTLAITRDANGVTISWSPTAAGQKLQSAPAVTGPWADVTGATNPYTAPATGAQTFYRTAQ